MFEIEAQTFETRLRGVNVTCIVTLDSAESPDVRIETRAKTLEQGVRAVSKFAGYCRRTLVLPVLSEDEDAWARVLASYYGFGLILESADRRREVMPAPAVDIADDQGPRRSFIRRVLAELPSA
ncbi:hypothetical protein M3147_12610 [Agromyces mediolanus]|uniref:hypothetical protein n=1 Tax=Agromyces mediolanus TaxID=41986 RepID=UPI00203D62A5|nr:hypothetical protein [Agromyces mediolanus]MCM3658091.1 hypothetical protein [Agromyces mediolanus]